MNNLDRGVTWCRINTSAVPLQCSGSCFSSSSVSRLETILSSCVARGRVLLTYPITVTQGGLRSPRLLETRVYHNSRLGGFLQLANCFEYIFENCVASWISSQSATRRYPLHPSPARSSHPKQMLGSLLSPYWEDFATSSSDMRLNSISHPVGNSGPTKSDRNLR